MTRPGRRRLVSSRTRALFGAVLLTIATVGIAPASHAYAAGPLTIGTASGTLQGVAVGAGREWRGMARYAAPTGSVRCAGGHRSRRRHGPASAMRRPSARTCIELDFPSGTFGSEDCLFLQNIPFWSTSTRWRAPLPVMVQLARAGGNFFGSGYQEASALVDRGVIVVTLD